VNARRIAALLRELADAFEQEEPKRKRKKHIAAPDVEPTKEAKDAAQRALRKAGVAA
jgi:hypothetical protein